jgi:hypothetical protein
VSKQAASTLRTESDLWEASQTIVPQLLDILEDSSGSGDSLTNILVTI